MKFKLNLGDGSDFSAIRNHYDSQMDDIRSILDDVCDVLEDSTSSEFIVSGFGQDRWPVDVRTDLSVLLEQLPDAMTAVQRGIPFLIDFYEQGIERTIRFDLRGDTYFAICESRTEWIPNPTVERIQRNDLSEMLRNISDEFLKYLAQNAPNIAAHPWVGNFFKNDATKLM